MSFSLASANQAKARFRCKTSQSSVLRAGLRMLSRCSCQSGSAAELVLCTNLRAASGIGNSREKVMRRWKALSIASGLLVIRIVIPVCASK